MSFSSGCLKKANKQISNNNDAKSATSTRIGPLDAVLNELYVMFRIDETKDCEIVFDWLLESLENNERENEDRDDDKNALRAPIVA